MAREAGDVHVIRACGVVLATGRRAIVHGALVHSTLALSALEKPRFQAAVNLIY